jgi:hypothetical protein
MKAMGLDDIFHYVVESFVLRMIDRSSDISLGENISINGNYELRMRMI